MKQCPWCWKRMVYWWTCKKCREEKTKKETWTVLLTIHWKQFRCSCGCNCFHKPSEEERKIFTEEFQDKNLYICNACQQAFEGE